MLLVSRRFLLRRSNVSSIFSMKSSTASSETTDAAIFNKEQIEIHKPTTESYFPWRQHIVREKNFQQYVANAVSRIIINEWLLNMASQRHPSSSYMEIDFLLGCQQAFRAATASIFQHEKLKSSTVSNANTVETMSRNNSSSSGDGNSTTPNSTTTSSSPVDVFVPELTTVLEENLAHFYDSAIQTSHKSKFQIHYELGAIGTPTIESYDVIFGGKRGKDFSGLKRHNTMGLIGTIGTEKKMSNAENYDYFALHDTTKTNSFFKNKPKDLQNLLEMRQFATVRLGVNIPMTETFCVKDELTGTVIQGSTEPTKVVHHVLFESVLNANDNGRFGDWSVVDVDGWLQNNEFWVTSKVVKTNKENNNVNT